MTPRLSIVHAAHPWIGRRETSRNQFTGMEKVWAATSYPDGWRNREPYCAAFVCYAVQQAAEKGGISVPIPPRSASCKGWQEWARNPKTGVLIFGPDSDTYHPQPGDIVNFLPHLSHIGIVEDYDYKTQLLKCIEANTSDVPAGSAKDREGEGVMRRWRKLSGCGEFYRIPCHGERLT